MEITRTSLWSGVTRTRDLNVTAAQLEQWQRGMGLQDAMPQLSVAERAFLLTGMTQEAWQDLTREDEVLAQVHERLEALEQAQQQAREHGQERGY